MDPNIGIPTRSNLQPPTPKQNSKFSNLKNCLIIMGIFVIVMIAFVVTREYINKTHSLTDNSTATKTLATKTATATPSDQSIYTQEQLSAMGSPKNSSSLPLGDNKYTTTTPQKGYIFLCKVMQGQGGAQETGNWINGTTWNLTKKPTVEGKVSWSNATFSNTISGNSRIISGNDLPMNTITGIFPIQSTDPAYQYDRNPNRITSHSFSLTLPLNPTYSSQPSCMGGEVGVMLNGVPLFNGFDAENRDAAAHEVQDSCDGHPQESGEYHYHSLSSCIKDIKETTVLGYALDGFPITGPVLDNGNYLTTNDLDECHGLTSQILLDGKQVTTYHYVMTEDFPYSVSCFRGKPVSLQVISGLSPGDTKGSQLGGQTGGSSQPPQTAFLACNGKAVNSSCTFEAPRGEVTGTCQTPPGQTSMVCVPTNSEQNQGKQLSQ